jgi:hypothetical protein
VTREPQRIKTGEKTMADPKVIWNPVKERIEFDATSENGVNHKVVFDLGVVNDSAWKLRYRLVINNSGIITGASTRFWIGLTDADETVNDTVAQNALQTNIQQGGGSTAWQLRSAHNVDLSGAGESDTLSQDPDPGTYYCELERVSYTVGNETVIFRVYSAPDFSPSSLIEEAQIELPNATTIDNLKYLFFQTTTVGDTTSQGFTGFVDQIQFWNGTKNPDQRLPDFVDNLDDSTKWLSVASGGTGGSITVDDPSFPKQIFFNSLNDAQDHRVIRKLPFVLSDEKWVIDFEYEVPAQSGAGHQIMNVTENSQDAYAVGRGASLEIGATNGGTPAGAGTNTGIRIGDGSANAQVTTDGDNVISTPNGTKIYIRFIRVSKEKIRMESYTDPERTNVYATALEGTMSAAFVVSDVKNLSWLQSGTRSVGGSGRDLTASIHNIRIYNGVNHIDLERIGAGAVPDFEDTFGGYFTQAEADEQWPSINVAQSRVNITTQVLDFKADTATDLAGTIVHDLQRELGRGVYMDDNKWVVRFKLNWSVLNFVSAGINHNFGLTAFDETVNAEDADDIFAMFTYIHALAGNSQMGSSSGALTPIPAGNPSDVVFNKFLAVATDYWFEIVRTSKTTGYVRQYADADYTEILEEFPFTNLTKSVSGLRYFKFTAKRRNSGGGSVGTLDDLEIWNGTDIPNEADKIKIKLGSCDTPAINTGNKLRWNAKGTVRFTRAKGQIWQDNVLIAESQFFELTSDWRTYEYELTVAEFNKITDWNKLSIAIVPDTVE